jgi:DNA invertase Pin-like site-specific DNA recombinase
MEVKFIAYYRVSTRTQENSGLGLESQKATVKNYISHNGNKIIGEFIETESGKNDNRPELIKAITLAKKENATLVISKLDRLSRNVTFISQLMDSKVKFVCADMPDANELTIHIFASLAQWERKRISERTKDALAAKKIREPNWKPGNPQNLTQDAKNKAHESISKKAREDVEVRKAYHFIQACKQNGLSYAIIAEKLNGEGYQTRNGKMFFASQVQRIYERFAE